MTRRRDVTDTQVLTMRQERARGSILKKLAKQYGISVGHVSKIVTGDYYPHLPGPRTKLRNGDTCMAGHPWTEESTYTYPKPNGGTRRACRTCRKLRVEVRSGQ